MPISEILSDEAVLGLPPMLFGKIRWSKGLAVLLETRVADSQFLSKNTPYPSFAWVQTVQR